MFFTDCLRCEKYEGCPAGNHGWDDAIKDCKQFEPLGKYRGMLSFYEDEERIARHSEDYAKRETRGRMMNELF